MFRNVLLSTILITVLSGCNSSSSSYQDLPQQLCSTQAEKNASLWQLLNEVYFWNDQLDPTTNPAEFDSLTALLDDVKAKNPVDRFSFVTPPVQNSFSDIRDSGTANDNGLSMFIPEDGDALLVNVVWPGSPADELGIKRGDKILSIENVSVEEILISESEPLPVIIDLLNNDNNALEIHWQDNTGNTLQGALAKRDFTIEPVFHHEVIDTPQGKIGYVVLAIFIPQSVSALNDVFQTFLGAEVEHLIIDLRFNGGGCCMDTQLESQIAGDNVIGKLAFSTFFNENLSGQNSTTYFALNNSIPAFDMDSVTFLTSKGTASASEGVIMGLTAYIDVKLVGGTTFGKNVGQSFYEVCGESVHISSARVEHANGFHIPVEGIAPTCSVQDTWQPEWGDEADPLLAEALFLYQNGHCSS